MIYGSIYHEKTYAFLPPRVQQALAFARTHDLAALPKGRIDIHVLAEGTEKIDVSLIERMQTHPYEEDKDYVPADGAVTQTTIMRPGDFLICYPEDVHRSGVKVDEAAPLKKGIFKIRVE